MAPSTLKIAVLVLPPVQLLDLSPVDLFHMLSREYLQDCRLPQPLLDLGLDKVVIHYVAEHGPVSGSAGAVEINGRVGRDGKEAAAASGSVLAETTASLAIRINRNFESADVQPGQVDVLFVPGPDPFMDTSEAAKRFIRAHAESGNTNVLSVCTGIIPLGKSGVLDGRTCTGPRALLGLFLRKDYPKAKWAEKRWVVDRSGASSEKGKGELWTAGGITNGGDMVAAYLREKFQSELAELVCGMADVGDRGQEYGNSSAAQGMWFGWLLLRSWFGGLWRSKKI